MWSIPKSLLGLAIVVIAVGQTSCKPTESDIETLKNLLHVGESVLGNADVHKNGARFSLQKREDPMNEADLPPDANASEALKGVFEEIRSMIKDKVYTILSLVDDGDFPGARMSMLDTVNDLQPILETLKTAAERVFEVSRILNEAAGKLDGEIKQTMDTINGDLATLVHVESAQPDENEDEDDSSDDTASGSSHPPKGPQLDGNTDISQTDGDGDGPQSALGPPSGFEGPPPPPGHGSSGGDHDGPPPSADKPPPSADKPPPSADKPDNGEDVDVDEETDLVKKNTKLINLLKQLEALDE